MAQLNAQRRMAAQILAMRNQRSAAQKPAAKKQSLYYQAAEQVWWQREKKNWSLGVVRCNIL